MEEEKTIKPGTVSNNMKEEKTTKPEIKENIMKIPEGLTDEERREFIRKKINIKKTFQVDLTIPGEDTKKCFLHIVDVSEGGIRLHADFPFPEEDKEYKVKIYLDQIVEFTGKTIWQKQLLGGIYIVGIQFLDLSEHDRESVNEFIEKYSLEGKRRTFRLNRVLAVEMELDNKKDVFYALTVDLTEYGMRITHETKLPENTEIKFRIVLYYDKKPIEVKAKVIWQKETSWGDNMIGLEFTEITPEARNTIKEYIDDVILGNISEEPVGFSEYNINLDDEGEK